MNDKIFIQKNTLKDIADAIREKEDSVEAIPTAEMAERIRAIESGDGVNLEEWCAVMQLKTLNGFKTSEAVLNLPLLTGWSSLVNRHNDRTGEFENTTVEHLTVTCPNTSQQANYMFACSAQKPDRKLRRLTLNLDFAGSTNVSYLFSQCAALEVVDGTPLDFSNITSLGGSGNIFYGCTSLAEVRFKGVIRYTLSFNQSPLSIASINSIFECLSDETEGMTITFNAACINKNYETALGTNDGSTSEEWAALIGTKPNWTFSLV